MQLRDGRKIVIVPLSRKITPKSLLAYINGIIDEDLYLTYDKKFTLKQQKEWCKDTLNNIKSRNSLYYAVIYNKKIIGSTSAKRGIGRDRTNICLGVAISKGFRGVGLGEILMSKVIKETKKRLKPINKIWLTVSAPNRPAIALYKKLGFKQVAKLKNWSKYKGKYIDVCYMVLK